MLLDLLNLLKSLFAHLFLTLVVDGHDLDLTLCKLTQVLSSRVSHANCGKCLLAPPIQVGWQSTDFLFKLQATSVDLQEVFHQYLCTLNVSLITSLKCKNK